MQPSLLRICAGSCHRGRRHNRTTRRRCGRAATSGLRGRSAGRRPRRIDLGHDRRAICPERGAAGCGGRRVAWLLPEIMIPLLAAWAIAQITIIRPRRGVADPRGHAAPCLVACTAIAVALLRSRRAPAQSSRTPFNTALITASSRIRTGSRGLASKPIPLERWLYRAAMSRTLAPRDC
jgi:hypothetical protein